MRQERIRQTLSRERRQGQVVTGRIARISALGQVARSAGSWAAPVRAQTTAGLSELREYGGVRALRPSLARQRSGPVPATAFASFVTATCAPGSIPRRMTFAWRSNPPSLTSVKGRPSQAAAV